jgi:hypothetical protein
VRPFGAARDAAGLRHMQEKPQVGEIEAQGKTPSAFVLSEGILRILHIANFMMGGKGGPWSCRS